MPGVFLTNPVLPGVYQLFDKGVFFQFQLLWPVLSGYFIGSLISCDCCQCDLTFYLCCIFSVSKFPLFWTVVFYLNTLSSFRGPI